jgi:Ca2+:H+ antiporter
MTPNSANSVPAMSWIAPVLALLFYFASSGLGFGATFQAGGMMTVLAVVLVPVLFGTVFAAVHHADVIAHRTGEPYGTLVLTSAVTIIEVALIASVMLGDPDGSPTLARDTVFAVVMTVCNGLAGLCILVGGLRHREQSFRVQGASAYLAVLMVLATLTLVLPNYTQETPGAVYSSSQLIFAGGITLLLYVVFLYHQTFRHREDFLGQSKDKATSSIDVPAPRVVAVSVVLLVLALAAVVLLSKKFAAVVEFGRIAIGAPPAVTGLVVAIVILLPEGIAAVKAARQDKLQKAINLALGSSLATIGLTFPAVAVVTLYLAKPLLLGLNSVDTALLALTLLISTLTFGTGRTNVLFGFVHLVVFVSYLFFTYRP